MRQDKAKAEFIDLYHQLSDSIFRYCLVRVSDREQAMDITQDTFMKYWDFVSTKGGVQSPRAFLYKIAGNLIIDWYRKKKSVSLDALLEPGEDESALQISDDSHLHIQIESEAKLLIDKIKQLDATYQQAVFLRFVEDLPPKEIASILGLDANTVSVRINRGIKELQKMMPDQKEI